MLHLPEIRTSPRSQVRAPQLCGMTSSLIRGVFVAPGRDFCRKHWPGQAHLKLGREGPVGPVPAVAEDAFRRCGVGQDQQSHQDGLWGPNGPSIDRWLGHDVELQRLRASSSSSNCVLLQQSRVGWQRLGRNFSAWSFAAWARDVMERPNIIHIMLSCMEVSDTIAVWRLWC